MGKIHVLLKQCVFSLSFTRRQTSQSHCTDKYLSLISETNLSVSLHRQADKQINLLVSLHSQADTTFSFTAQTNRQTDKPFSFTAQTKIQIDKSVSFTA